MPDKKPDASNACQGHVQIDPCPLKRLGGREYYCAVELSLQVLGGKWKPIILWHLGRDGTYRFSELKRLMPNITQKMLTRQLRELESDGLIDRKVYAQVPPKVEYSLTETGHGVMPVLQELCQWGKAFEKLTTARNKAREKDEPDDIARTA